MKLHHLMMEPACFVMEPHLLMTELPLSRSEASPSYDGACLFRDDASPFYDGACLSRDGASPFYDGASLSRDDASPFYDGACLSRDEASPFYDGASPLDRSLSKQQSLALKRKKMFF